MKQLSSKLSPLAAYTGCAACAIGFAALIALTGCSPRDPTAPRVQPMNDKSALISMHPSFSINTVIV